MAYGQKFKEIRRSNLLSQEEFAKQVGVSRSVISQIEIDKIKPTLDALNFGFRHAAAGLEHHRSDHRLAQRSSGLPTTQASSIAAHSSSTLSTSAG